MASSLLFGTTWTVACQAPLAMRFSGQEYWSGLPCPSPGDLPEPGIKPSPALQADSLPFEPPSLGVCIPNPELLCGFLLTFAIYGHAPTNVTRFPQAQMNLLLSFILSRYQMTTPLKSSFYTALSREK